MAGHREVWTRTHGRASRYHVEVDGCAACAPNATLGGGNRRIVLGDLIPAADVPTSLRCRRAACAKRWPVARDTVDTSTHGERGSQS